MQGPTSVGRANANPLLKAVVPVIALGLALAGGSARGSVILAMPGGNVYEYVTGRYTFSEALGEAHTHYYAGVQGHLVTITSQAEQDFVHGLVNTSYAAWMGASDAQEEGVWRWVDGPEAGVTFWTQASGTVTFAAWTPGEPNNYRTGENYGVLNWDYGVQGLWNGAPGTTSAWETRGTVGYVVEYEVPEPVTGVLFCAGIAAVILRRPGK